MTKLSRFREPQKRLGLFIDDDKNTLVEFDDYRGPTLVPTIGGARHENGYAALHHQKEIDIFLDSLTHLEQEEELNHWLEEYGGFIVDEINLIIDGKPLPIERVHISYFETGHHRELKFIY